MLKRLTVAFAALAIGLLPLTAAMADDHEAPAPEPTLGEVVAAAVADYLVGLDLAPEVAAEVGATLGDLVQELADAAAEEVAEPVVFEDEEGDEGDEGDDEQEADEDFEAELQELDEEVDETHGEIVSTVAQCAPRGRLLQGTGVNHGTFVSAVAGGNPVVVPAVVEGEVDLEGGQEFTVETVEDAEALCAALETFADDLEAAQSAAEVEAASSSDQKAAKGNKANKGKAAKKDR